MKRLHVHVAVDDVAKSIDFYSALFDTGPSVVKSDYAKWMLDDPRVNFARARAGPRSSRHPGRGQGRTERCLRASAQSGWHCH
jgi:catechol 2,3-dioxygenase-like lactoylglutathione lyase family enzyme